MIQRHGNLERLARDEAARWGWTATPRDLDLDIYETERHGYRVPKPGAGTIDLARDGRVVAVEYWLPEDEDEFRRTIRSAVHADDIETDRLHGSRDGLAVGG